MRERVLVTGAAGFIGSHLCHRLVADGLDVVGFDDLSSGSLSNLDDTPEVRLELGDVTDADALRSAARGCRVVYHQAAKLSVPRSMLEPGETLDVNVRGTINVLLAALDLGAVVVAASSSAVYGDQQTFPIAETALCAPMSPYAASKLAGETIGIAFARSHGLATAWLRYFNVYGPGQDPASEYAAVIPRFIVACLMREPAVIYGDGLQSRDFVYIDDVVEANLLAARLPERAIGSAFNIGGGAPTAIGELHSMIARSCGVEPRIVSAPVRDGDVRESLADLSFVRATIGYEPAVPIVEGIARTVASFRERLPVEALPER